MPPMLAEFYNSLKTLCYELNLLRQSPRPRDADWRHHGPSLDEAREHRMKCRGAADVCLAALDAAMGQFPDSWLGDDPQSSKYIRLKYALGTVISWLYECQLPYRGFKMPMDCDGQDQHDAPEAVKSWNDAEREIRVLGDELKALIDLHDAKTAAASVIPAVPPPQPHATTDLVAAAAPPQQPHATEALGVSATPPPQPHATAALGAPVIPPPQPHATAVNDPHAPYYPPHHFANLHGIPGERLRRARKDRRITAKNIGTNESPRWHYSEPDAHRLWPTDVATSATDTATNRDKPLPTVKTKP
ncbi:MAG: hypothetical protein K8S99_01030 [Planctomycetes bacterium]|nr:hypothetical protein [Planctomycetota bacterium]